jgi:hypothetical protein
MFKVTENLEKTKIKMLVFSGISLFIALTETLPNKVSVIGLNFSGKESIFGWFVVSISLYFFIRYILLSLLKIIQYYLPNIIAIQASKTTGKTIGLTVNECFESYHDNENYDIGTISGEIHEINEQNKALKYQYNSSFIKISNFITLLFEIIAPSIFSITSIVLLWKFLSQC